MTATCQSGESAWALEIVAGIAGRRFGLCGFGVPEAERISKALRSTDSLLMPFEERLLGESAQVCDAIVVKLASLSPEGLRAAAASPAPILVAGADSALMQGAGAAYVWPRDLLCEPWTDAELVIRLFRLLQSSGSLRAAAARERRIEPLVLLADDDPEMVALIDATLRNDGIACRVAEDGLTALQLARELVPDLILLDVRMPKLDGFDVLQTVRWDPAIQMVPVILLTGCSDLSDVRRGSELHADEYLVKPVSPNILLNRVKRLLSSHANPARRWDRTMPGGKSFDGVSGRKWTVSGSARTRTAGQP